MASCNPFAVALLILTAAFAAGQPTLPGLGQNGGLDRCQVVLGSAPAGDGTFDRVPDFTASTSNGVWTLPETGVPERPGDVFYVVPAPKDATDDDSVCHSTVTQLPQYNPLAVSLPSSSNISLTEVQASPLSTVLVFGQAFGLTDSTLGTAFGLDPATDISTYNAQEEFAADPSGPMGAAYKEDNKISSIVTQGTNLLSNSSDTYASFAVLVYQAIGRAALNAANSQGNAQMAASGPALNLNDPATVGGIFSDAAQHAGNTRDSSIPSFLTNPSEADTMAVANVTAGLSNQIDGATTIPQLAQIQAGAQNTVAPQVQELAQGGIDAPGFVAATRQPSTSAQQGAQPQSESSPSTPGILPGSRAIASSPPALNTSSQASASQKHHGLSGGAIAGIVIGCAVVSGVAVLALLLVVRAAGRADSPHQGGLMSRFHKSRTPRESPYSIPGQPGAGTSAA